MIIPFMEKHWYMMIQHVVTNGKSEMSYIMMHEEDFGLYYNIAITAAVIQRDCCYTEAL